MAAAFTRILSDIHYGDRATRVARLTQLAPLLDGVPDLVLNGDTLDTRPGPHPAHTTACRAEVSSFFAASVPSVTFLTGNHDSDLSPHHALDLAAGEVFVLHGDIFFETLVPWSQDSHLIARLIADELRAMPPAHHHVLENRLAMVRRVTAAIPQRHQSERHGVKYFLRFLSDTVWPPTRLLRILDAWRLAPRSAADFAARHRPRARFVIAGHTHHPGIRQPDAAHIVINTGSFCRPLGGTLVDISETHVQVRRVVPRAGEFRPGGLLAEFPLAGS